MGIQIPLWKWAIFRGDVPAYCNIPMHECIAIIRLPSLANVPAHSVRG